MWGVVLAALACQDKQHARRNTKFRMSTRKHEFCQAPVLVFWMCSTFRLFTQPTFLGLSRKARACTHTHTYIYIKVNWSRYRPGVAQRVGRGIALLFHNRGTRTGWVVSSTPRPHFTPGKDPVPILQEVGWAPGPVWTGGKSRPHLDLIPDRPSRSQSLYRLSYPDHTHTHTPTHTHTHTHTHIYIYIVYI